MAGLSYFGENNRICWIQRAGEQVHSAARLKGIYSIAAAVRLGPFQLRLISVRQFSHVAGKQALPVVQRNEKRPVHFITGGGVQQLSCTLVVPGMWWRGSLSPSLSHTTSKPADLQLTEHVQFSKQLSGPTGLSTAPQHEKEDRFPSMWWSVTSMYNTTQ